MDVTTKTLSLQLTKLVSAGPCREKCRIHRPVFGIIVLSVKLITPKQFVKSAKHKFHVEGKAQKASDLILTLRHISTTTHRSRKIEHGQQYLKLSLFHWIKTVTCQSVSKFSQHRVNATLFCSYLRTGMILFRFQILPASCKHWV